MPRYRINHLADLERQLEFAPIETRLGQLASAEQLLHDLEPTKAYPLDYVVYRITGYQRRGSTPVNTELLTGLALQHDLGLLIEQLSDSLNLSTVDVSEPVLTIEDVCARFNVTSKTIQRWRRRGLPARRFTFPDQKRRVGFLLSSVERFLDRHGEQVRRGTDFSQVQPAERDLIIRRARRLAGQCRCCVNEISRRIGRRLNRSPLTILHVIRKHDAENPGQAVFPEAADSITPREKQEILESYRRGVALKALARRSCRPVSAIYRVILQDRLDRVLRRKVRFIDDPLYHDEHADQIIQAIVRQAEQQLSPSSVGEVNRIPRDLPPYLQSLYRQPLLTPEQERAMFLHYNFLKYQFVQARRRIDEQLARARDVNLLEKLLERVAQAKNRIVSANLRLVVSVARKHLRPGLCLMELISEGNITLMRAVESFDIHKGNKFSTYATLALMKGFARSVPRMLLARRTGGEEMLAELPDHRTDRQIDVLLERDQVGVLLSRLDARERQVLRAHYGLDSDAPATFEQLSHRLGLSTARLRQIERSAMDKLRAMQ